MVEILNRVEWIRGERIICLKVFWYSYCDYKGDGSDWYWYESRFYWKDCRLVFWRVGVYWLKWIIEEGCKSLN